jgi:hypothetical protein
MYRSGNPGARWWQVIAIALGILAAGGAAPAAGEDSDWPCIQRLVPKVSAGMVWAGPPLDEAPDWRDDSAVSDLANRLADRRLPPANTETLVEEFARSLGAENDQQLTMLFAAVLDRINNERLAVIEGIKKLTRRQRALASRIESALAEIDSIPDEGTAEQKARRVELIEQTRWDTRIYEEREKSVVYLCETPVLLEQRVFILGRTIQGFLN